MEPEQPSYIQALLPLFCFPTSRAWTLKRGNENLKGRLSYSPKSKQPSSQFTAGGREENIEIRYDTGILTVSITQSDQTVMIAGKNGLNEIGNSI